MPSEEQTYREGVNRTLERIESSMTEGFKGVYKRQDHTNGHVRKHEVILYCLIVAFITSLISHPAIGELLIHLIGA